MSSGPGSFMPEVENSQLALKYEMHESHPDWVPSLQLGPNEVKSTQVTRFNRWTKRQKPPAVETAAQQEDTGESPLIEECSFCQQRSSEIDLLLEENRKLKEQLAQVKMDSMKVEDTKELQFCTPLSSSMMEAGVCLRRDTETTLPELTEQHRIRPKEEELSGLESVHMAEPETECPAPGLNTLEPECVTAHSGVSDVHHMHTTLLKMETDINSTHTGDLKTESLDSTEQGYVTHLHPDQIKTEVDDGIHCQLQHISDLQDIKYVYIKSDQMKYESSGSLVSDPMNSEMNGAGVDQKNQTEPRQCAGELIPNCKKEEINDLLTQSEDLNHHCDINHENNQTRIVQKTDGSMKHFNFQRTNVISEPTMISSSKPSLLNFIQKTIPRKKGRIHASEMGNKCIWCGKCFKMKYSLNRHVRIHTGEKPYKCSLCGKGFCQKSDLNGHRRVHMGEKSYKCTQCERSYYTQSGLRFHQINHTGEKPYKCSQCGKCFSRKGNLSGHMMVHTGEKPYKCTECEKCFNRKYALNAHLRIHAGEKPYRCTQCEKCFNGKSELKVHLGIHTGVKPYKCTQCEKCFNYNSTFIRHLKNHTGEKPYKCTQCEKYFFAKCELNVHMRIHTGEKPYKCTQCEKCFNYNSAFNRHLRIHTGERPYKCTQCEKCFIAKSELNIHLGIHTGLKPYKCTQCEKCFNHNSAFNRHLRIHTAEKSFKCTQCEKCFNTASYLNIHLRIHTGEKPYKCTQCDKCFTYNSAFKRHLRSHTGENLLETHSGENPSMC